MKNILIIRHAESTANAGERTTAHDTIPLSEKGKMQAEELVETLDIIPELIVVSPFTRTQETAAPFIFKHQDVPVEIWNVQEFTYLTTKKYNNTTTEERRGDVKKFWDLGDIHYQDDVDVETFRMFIERIQHFISKVTARPEKNIVIFSHGGFIQNLKNYLEVVGEQHSAVVHDETIKELMSRYRGILGTTFPIENASVHRLDF
jgi:2,3-bisphosphoglycerate-dependent phosphoglycerate mutase